MQIHSEERFFYFIVPLTA